MNRKDLVDLVLSCVPLFRMLSRLGLELSWSSFVCLVAGGGLALYVRSWTATHSYKYLVFPFCRFLRFLSLLCRLLLEISRTILCGVRRSVMTNSCPVAFCFLMLNVEMVYGL